MSLNRTLLQVVQSTLGAMDSDAVDTIGETPESEQIVLIAQEVFYEVATHQDVPHFQKVSQLLASGKSELPTVMFIPESCTDISAVRYQHRSNSGRVRMERITYLDKNAFLDQQLCLDISLDRVGENVFEDNIRIPYYRDRDPCYFTSFDEKTLVFDALDEEFDDTLKNDKSLAVTYQIPDFLYEDDFVIPLPEQFQSQYLAQVKEVAFSEQKQMPSVHQEEKSKRQRRRNWQQASTTDGMNNGNNGEPFRGFGRPSTGYGRSGSSRYGKGRRGYRG